MLVLRCTRRLLKHVAPSPPAAVTVVRSTTRLGDWTATEVIARRQHLVLAVSHVTLLPVLVPRAPAKSLAARFAEMVGLGLLTLAVDPAKATREVSAMRECVVTTTNDRQVLGSLNDFARMLDSYLDAESLMDVALLLAESPCGPLGMRSPETATRELFSRPVLRVVGG